MSGDNDSKRLARFLISRDLVEKLSTVELQEWISCKMVEISNSLGLSGLRVDKVVRSEIDEAQTDVVVFYDFYGQPEQHMMPVPDGWADPPSKPTIH